jgi:hypothetical protein
MRKRYEWLYSGFNLVYLDCFYLERIYFDRFSGRMVLVGWDLWLWFFEFGVHLLFGTEVDFFWCWFYYVMFWSWSFLLCCLPVEHWPLHQECVCIAVLIFRGIVE